MSNGHVKIYSTNAKTSMLFVSLLVLYNNDSFEIGELKNVHYQFLKNPEFWGNSIITVIRRRRLKHVSQLWLPRMSLSLYTSVSLSLHVISCLQTNQKPSFSSQPIEMQINVLELSIRPEHSVNREIFQT